MSLDQFTRRRLLKLGVGALATEIASSFWSGCGGGSIPQPDPGPSVCGKLSDIEHVVILIQENRSFDHYFGSLGGVREDFPTRVPLFGNQIRRIPRTHPRVSCCHFI